MNFVIDILTIVVNGLRKLSLPGLSLTFFIAVVLSLGCLILCNYYSRLWNKSFKKTRTHNLLSVLAALLTFIFVLAFASLTFFQEISNVIILKWQATVNFDKKWQEDTFKKSYQAVRACCEDSEPFKETEFRDSTKIPLTTDRAREAFAQTYANEGSKHFDENHPFLNTIWTNPKVSPVELRKDVQDYFGSGGKKYPPGRAIELIANKVRENLKNQTPKVILFSKIMLIILFFIVQAIPFGLIGLAAYNSLKVKV